MTVNIIDLGPVLDYFSDSKPLKKQFLLIQLNQLRLPHYVNWNEMYKLGIQLKFIREHDDKISITNNGKIFHSMGITNEITVEQKYFILKNGILGNNSFQKINNFLSIFSLNNEDVFEVYKTENKFEKNKLNLDDIIILNELDVLKNLDDRYTINTNYSELIFQTFFLKRNTLSQKELDKILDEQKRIGELGEKLTLQYEKNEFEKKGWKYQKDNVRIIGRENVEIGYDVESFLTKKSHLNLARLSDKHIEVKGRKYDERSFIISANELEIAHKLSKRNNEEYLIYFWNNLGKKKLPAAPTKIIPFKKLKIKPCKNCISYIVDV